MCEVRRRKNKESKKEKRKIHSRENCLFFLFVNVFEGNNFSTSRWTALTLQHWHLERHYFDFDSAKPHLTRQPLKMRGETV